MPASMATVGAWSLPASEKPAQQQHLARVRHGVDKQRPTPNRELVAAHLTAILGDSRPAPQWSGDHAATVEMALELAPEEVIGRQTIRVCTPTIDQ
jgi:hypothetical protein